MENDNKPGKHGLFFQVPFDHYLYFFWGHYSGVAEKATTCDPVMTAFNIGTGSYPRISTFNPETCLNGLEKVIEESLSILAHDTWAHVRDLDEAPRSQFQPSTVQP